ncbi:MAG: hypothetical protein DLM58_06220 [Pseudonocardiales bacterium]|nr:MAG: hypothetical protein DLM58_06220 [Pseudonocardiales bacterium]
MFFPGAGSFGTEFQPLLDALGPGSVIRYPGRAGRGFGIPAASFETAVDACVEQVAARGGDAPVLFGHSFGAYAAHATAVSLRQVGIAVAGVVVVGASSPALVRVPERAIGTPQQVADYLDSVDPDVLAHTPSPDWREIVVETTAHDLRLLRQFDFAAIPRAVHAVLAIRGDADPLTTDDALDHWRTSTDGAFARHTVPGRHSDFLRRPAFVSWFVQLPAVPHALPQVTGDRS